MTKEQFINKWPYLNDTRDTINPYFIADLEAVIATEVSKAKEQEVNEIKKNFYFYKQVMNPYETGSQSYTAYEKGFEEGYNKFQEIAKVQENKPQPVLNPIEQAYHAFQPIRYILWKKGWRIKKHSDTESIDANGRIFNNTCFVFDFDKNPQKWEIYTELTAQPSSKVKLDNSFDRDGFEAMFHPEFWELHAEPEQTAKPFDKDRFEAMFRAVVANGGHELEHKQAIELTEEALTKLDAYYASKEGGNNE